MEILTDLSRHSQWSVKKTKYSDGDGGVLLLWEIFETFQVTPMTGPSVSLSLSSDGIDK